MGLCNPNPHIGTSADLNTLHRVVSHVYTNRDPRHVGARPLAAEILLGFWGVFLGRGIEMLERIYCETVEDETVDDIRDVAYDWMYAGALTNDLEIRCEGGSREEALTFDRIYNHTKLGRCARTMVTQNWDMVRFGIFVSQFAFRPHPEGDDAPVYDFIISFDVDPVLQPELRAQREQQRWQQIGSQQRQDPEYWPQQEAQWQWQQADWGQQGESHRQNQQHRRRHHHHHRSSSRHSYRE